MTGDEECDCGIPASSGNQSIYTTGELQKCQTKNGNSLYYDPCCTPECKLDRAGGKVCSPKKGECCSKESDPGGACQYKGLDTSSVDASTLQPKDMNVASNAQHICKAGTDCARTAYVNP